MIKHEITIHLDRPVDQVFAFLLDTSQLTKWQSNLIKVEKLTEGPFRMGSRFQEVRRLGRKETEIQGEITVFEANKRFQTKTLTKPQVTVSYFLEPENGGTRVKHRFVMMTSGLMRLLEPVIAKSIREENDLDLENLKRVLEN